MKSIFLLFLSSCLFITKLTAQSQGPLNGTLFSVSSIAGFSQGWTNTGDAASSNDTYASFGNLPNPAGTYTNYLMVTGFSFNIPFGIIISGITVEIERSDPDQKTSDYSIRIVKNAAIGTAERATGLAYPASDAYQSYGGSSDLWGQAWTNKDITNANFGVAIAAQRNASGGTTSGRIDHVRITVHYQFTVTLPVKLISFSAAKNKNTVQVKWTTAEESSIDHYEVERSVNGRDFSAIGEVMSRNSAGTTAYMFTDNNPVKGVSWYRLKIAEQSGTSKNSSIVSIHLDETGNNNLYPSLLYTGQSLYVSNPGSEALKIQLFNAGGQMVLSVTTTSGIIAPSSLMKSQGTYYYKVFDTKDILTGSGKIMLR